jgi:hypothetical protein
MVRPPPSAISRNDQPARNTNKSAASEMEKLISVKWV